MAIKCSSILLFYISALFKQNTGMTHSMRKNIETRVSSWLISTKKRYVIFQRMWGVAVTLTGWSNNSTMYLMHLPGPINNNITLQFSGFFYQCPPCERPGRNRLTGFGIYFLFGLSQVLNFKELVIILLITLFRKVFSLL